MFIYIIVHLNYFNVNIFYQICNFFRYSLIHHFARFLLTYGQFPPAANTPPRRIPCTVCAQSRQSRRPHRNPVRRPRNRRPRQRRGGDRGGPVDPLPRVEGAGLAPGEAGKNPQVPLFAQDKRPIQGKINYTS